MILAISSVFVGCWIFFTGVIEMSGKRDADDSPSGPAPKTRRALQSVDPNRVGTRSAARSESSEVDEIEIRWAAVVCLTHRNAKTSPALGNPAKVEGRTQHNKFMMDFVNDKLELGEAKLAHEVAIELFERGKSVLLPSGDDPSTLEPVRVQFLATHAQHAQLHGVFYENAKSNFATKQGEPSRRPR